MNKTEYITNKGVGTRRYNKRARAMINIFREECGKTKAYPDTYSGFRFGKLKGRAN